MRKLAWGLGLSGLAVALGTALGIGVRQSMNQSAARLEAAERMHARSMDDAPPVRPGGDGVRRSFVVGAPVGAAATVTTAAARSERAPAIGTSTTAAMAQVLGRDGAAGQGAAAPRYPRARPWPDLQDEPARDGAPASPRSPAIQGTPSLANRGMVDRAGPASSGGRSGWGGRAGTASRDSSQAGDSGRVNSPPSAPRKDWPWTRSRRSRRMGLR